MEILKTSDLSNKIISSSAQSRETIPLSHFLQFPCMIKINGTGNLKSHRWIRNNRIHSNPELRTYTY